MRPSLFSTTILLRASAAALPLKGGAPTSNHAVLAATAKLNANAHALGARSPNISDTVTNVGGEVWDIAGGAVDVIGDAVENVGGEVYDTAGSVAGAVGEAAGKVGGQVGDTSGEAVDGVGAAVNPFFGLANK